MMELRRLHLTAKHTALDADAVNAVVLTMGVRSIADGFRVPTSIA